MITELWLRKVMKCLEHDLRSNTAFMTAAILSANHGVLPENVASRMYLCLDQRRVFIDIIPVRICKPNRGGEGNPC